MGAQAIYLHTGDADIAVPVFTTDGDLVIEPARLKATPKLSEAMTQAQFRPGLQPGCWLCQRPVGSVMATIPVDLLVPESVAGSGRRAARLGLHGARVGRRARGLEGALVEHHSYRLESLAPDDRRGFQIRVAGPTALLIAKLHKIVDRRQESGARRLDDKDALDVLRILRAIPSRAIADALTHLQADALSGEITREAVAHLKNLFGSLTSAGTQMAVRATERLEDPAVIAASCAALAHEVLGSLARSDDRLVATGMQRGSQ